MRQVLDRASRPLAEAVAEGRVPGGVLGVVDVAGGRAVRAFGRAQVLPVERPMEEGTWFDLASLTKVIFTTTRILQLAGEGVIELDAPLRSVIPDFAQHYPESWLRRVTFRQCLGHQTGFPGVFPLYTYGKDPDLLRQFVLHRDWREGPSVYSDINFILLGIVLERLEGKWIRQMNPGAGFAWRADSGEAAATEHCPWRGRVLVGEVHDENCAALQGAGHAGLFGTVSAVLDYALDVLNANTLLPSSVALMREPLSETRTHGWERRHAGWSGGDVCSDETIGHTGFTGTGLWIDFAKGRAWTLLTNRVHPSRHFDSGIVALRRAVGDLVSQ